MYLLILPGFVALVSEARGAEMNFEETA